MLEESIQRRVPRHCPPLQLNKALTYPLPWLKGTTSWEMCVEKERERVSNINVHFSCILQFEEVKSMGVVDIDTGRPLPSAVHSMNAYLG